MGNKNNSKKDLSNKISLINAKSALTLLLVLTFVGFVIALDTEAPTITLNGPANNTYSSEGFYLNWTVIDDQDTNMSCYRKVTPGVEVSFYAPNDTATVAPYFAGLADGTYTWFVNCSDDSNNTVKSETRKFYIDQTPPSYVELVHPYNGEFYSNNQIDVNVTAIDNMANLSSGNLTCSFFRDGGAYNNDEIPFSITNNTNEIVDSFAVPDDDVYYMWVTCLDAAGNANTSAMSSFVVDTTPPNITLVGPANNSYFRNDVYTNWTVTDSLDTLLGCNRSISPGASYSTTVQNGSYGEVLEEIASNGSDDGIYTWFVNCTDNSNNTGASQIRTFIADATVPSLVQINSPADGEVSQTGVFDVNITATDNLANVTSGNLTCSFTLNGGVYSNSLYSGYKIANGTSNELANLQFTPGEYTIFANCSDAAGNTNVSAIHTFRYDVGPEIEIISPSDNIKNGTAIMFNVSAIDEFNLTDSCLISFNGGDNNTLTNNGDYYSREFNLGEGTYDVTYFCNDSLGIISNLTQTLNIDLTDPVLLTRNAVAGDNNVTISITSNESINATINYGTTTSLGSRAANVSFSNSSGVDISGLVNSTRYYYNITICDQAGNCVVNGTYNFTTTDFEGPEIEIISPSDFVKNGSILINISAIDEINNTESCWYNFNDGADFDLTKEGDYYSWTGGHIDEGTYNVTYFCNDSLGNEANITQTLVIDESDPILLTESSTVSSTGATIAYTSNESINATINYGTSDSLGTLANNEAYSSSSSVTLSGLSASTDYYYNITICDQAGNCVVNGTYSFTTSAAVVSRRGGGGGIVSKWVKELKLNSSEMNLGQALKIVKAKYRITFNVSGLGHHVGVMNMTNNSVTIEVASTPQIATLLLGESKKFDVDANGYYDILVKLVSIAGKDASLSINLINEKIASDSPTPAKPEVQPPIETQPIANGGPVTNDEAANNVNDESNEGSNTWMYILAIIALGIIVIVVVSSTKKLSGPKGSLHRSR